MDRSQQIPDMHKAELLPKKPSFKTKSKCTLLCDSRDRLKLDHLQNVLDLLSYYMIHIGLTVTCLSSRH